jgi:hypothetical protein
MHPIIAYVTLVIMVRTEACVRLVPRENTKIFPIKIAERIAVFNVKQENIPRLVRQLVWSALIIPYQQTELAFASATRGIRLRMEVHALHVYPENSKTQGKTKRVEAAILVRMQT